MNDLVSVIVPVYKVENYLCNCIESILNQTYGNMEIILVDDGSPDGCGRICDEYTKKDNRIRVIHKENGGLSDARNAGIEIATGKYIVFIDSDDVVHRRMIEFLYNGIVKDKADISVCAFKKVQAVDDIFFPDICNPHMAVIEENDDKTEYFFESNYEEFTVAWNKMYPIEYFEKIRFPKGKIHEDEFTTYKLLEKANRIIFIKEPLYFYIQRGDSIMGETFNEKRLMRLDAYLERMEHYRNISKYDWYEKTLFLYKLFLVRYAADIKKNDNMDIKSLTKYKNEYKKCVLSSLPKLNISIKKKCSYLAYAFYPGIVYRK